VNKLDNNNNNTHESEEYNPDYDESALGVNPKAGFDKAALVAESVRKCFTKRAVDMKSGYETTVLDRDGLAHKKIVDDQRKIFVGAVLGLTSILRSEILKHPEFKKKLEYFESTKEELFNKYSYKESKYVEDIDENGKKVIKYGQVVAKEIPVEDGSVWMPAIGEILDYYKIVKPTPANPGKLVLSREQGAWDRKVNAYWEKMLELSDIWFGDLMCLIDGPLENYAPGAGGM